jgi:dipeptidyl aminopeptidase/acylaminoacyl peptidase
MCVFQGECHDLSRSGTPLHRKRRLQEILKWFDDRLK